MCGVGSVIGSYFWRICSDVDEHEAALGRVNHHALEIRPVALRAICSRNRARIVDPCSDKLVFKRLLLGGDAWVVGIESLVALRLLRRNEIVQRGRIVDRGPGGGGADRRGQGRTSKDEAEMKAEL